MRIAHLACVAPPEIGGIGQVAIEEVRRLRAQGEEAVLFVPQGAHQTPSDEAVQRLPAYWRVGNAASLPLDRVRAWKPDVVHLHYPFYGTAEFWLLTRPSIPTVVTFHMDATPGGWRAPITCLHKRLIQNRLLRHAAAILISSRDYAQRSSVQVLLASLDDHIFEVPFAVDTEVFQPLPKKDARTVRLLFVGGMDVAHHFKGVRELITALQPLADLDWTLELVGDGALRPSYEAYAATCGLTHRVTFRGRVSPGDLVQAYQQANVLVFPSTTAAEAFGLVALEAHACGVPVIASDLPGVRTVVRHEETGLLVPPGDVERLRDAIRRFLEDRSWSERLGAQARASILEKYAWDAHIQMLQQIYQNVCASP